MMRVGVGFDSHPLAAGRLLIIGGVEIPFEKGLGGHSDADVLSHAIADALLGAMGEGDLGTHFPDTDSSYKGISSQKILRRVAAMLLKKRYRMDKIVISPAGEENLRAYSWPGNVRELSHELERALILSPGKPIDFESLASGGQKEQTSFQLKSDWLNPSWDFPEDGISLEEAIHRFIELALEKTDNNLSAAARLLNVKRDYLRYRLKK